MSHMYAGTRVDPATREAMAEERARSGHRLVNWQDGGEVGDLTWHSVSARPLTRPVVCTPTRVPQVATVFGTVVGVVLAVVMILYFVPVAFWMKVWV